MRKGETEIRGRRIQKPNITFTVIKCDYKTERVTYLIANQIRKQHREKFSKQK